jgi:type IV pilus assembly protein PilV
MSSSIPTKPRLFVGTNQTPIASASGAVPVCALELPVSPRRGCRLSRVASRQSGVGLIEVLVAVLVLSIAFLGIAALQAMSLSTNNSAMARSMATINSYSIFDAMRADKASALSSTLPYNTTVKGNACPAAGTTLAGAQLNQWCRQLAGSLGASADTQGKVVCTTTGECQVTISFNNTRAGVSSSNIQTVVTEAML